MSWLKYGVVRTTSAAARPAILVVRFEVWSFPRAFQKAIFIKLLLIVGMPTLYEAHST